MWWYRRLFSCCCCPTGTSLAPTRHNAPSFRSSPLLYSNVVRDTLTEFPTLSVEARERLVTSLLVTLTSHTSTTPTIAV